MLEIESWKSKGLQINMMIQDYGFSGKSSTG